MSPSLYSHPKGEFYLVFYRHTFSSCLIENIGIYSPVCPFIWTVLLLSENTRHNMTAPVSSLQQFLGCGHLHVESLDIVLPGAAKWTQAPTDIQGWVKCSFVAVELSGHPPSRLPPLPTLANPLVPAILSFDFSPGIFQPGTLTRSLKMMSQSYKPACTVGVGSRSRPPRPSSQLVSVSSFHDPNLFGLSHILEWLTGLWKKYRGRGLWEGAQAP